MNAAAPAPSNAPLNERELDALQGLLDQLPADREPLDLVMIDGFLCGVLLQPQPVTEAHWLARVLDAEGRPPPADFDAERVAALLRRRRAELDVSIARRRWFDPWVYQLDEAATPSETVLPWVAGFAAAMDAFPALLQRHEAALTEALVLLYRHFDPDDLEDADALLEQIEELEPPADLAEAVEDLVVAVLLVADVSRPLPAATRPVRRRPGGRAGPGPGPRSRSGRRA